MVPVFLLRHPKKSLGRLCMSLSLLPVMLSLTDDDYAALSHLQHDRLRSLFPAELQDATLETGLDQALIIACDWEAIALLNEDWDAFAHFIYLVTGCDRALFYVDGQRVLTQTRAVGSELTASTEDQTMVAVAERSKKHTQALETMVEAAEEAVATKPRRGLNEIVQELADEIALRAIARIEASAVMANHAIRGQETNGNTPEQAPELEAIPETPAKLPTVRLKGIYTPTSSNFVQSAKRYLKAVDPTGDAARALKEIVSQSPTGQAHLARAVRAYPADQQEKARVKLLAAFSKINDERQDTSAHGAS